MAVDRIITFSGPGPTRDDILAVLADFLGGAGSVEATGPDTWVVRLPGVKTYALKSRPGVGEYLNNLADPKLGADMTGRGFEVFKNPKTGRLLVTTRLADDFTTALADGVAEVFARYWKGAIDR